MSGLFYFITIYFVMQETESRAVVYLGHTLSTSLTASTSYSFPFSLGWHILGNTCDVVLAFFNTVTSTEISQY